MAEPREYGYFIKGSKIALIQKDTAVDNDVNSKDYGPDASGTRYISPKEAVTDGIELEYIYSPKYRINDIATTEAGISFDGSSGVLTLTKATNWTITSGFIIVRFGDSRIHGLHEIDSVTTTVITTKTKYSGEEVIEGFTVYTDIDVLNDENDELPISEYLSKAVVYFVKAKLAEDRGDFNLKQAMMREFYRIVEKNDNAKIHTIRRVVPHSMAIR